MISNLRLSNIVSLYFYPNRGIGRESLRKTIIDNYQKNHRKTQQTDEIIIKALSGEAKKVLATLPKEIQPYLLRTKRIRSKRNVLEHHYQLTCTRLSRLIHLTQTQYDAIAIYYLLYVDIEEIKNNQKKAHKLLHTYEIFKSTCPAYDILQWHKSIRRYLKKMRYKNEWFAIYYAMKDYLKPHSMTNFAKLMNEWYPKAKLHCSYCAMDDYMFLLSTDFTMWNTLQIPVSSKASTDAIKRMQTYLLSVIKPPIMFTTVHELI